MPPRPPAPVPAPARRPASGVRTPEELARARARARAAGRKRALAARAQRKAEARARRVAALLRWTHRTGAVGTALAVVLVAAVVVSGVQAETPAAASIALDPVAAATQLRDELTTTTTDLQAAHVAVTVAENTLATARTELASAQTTLATARTAVGGGAGELYQDTPADRAVTAGYPAGTDPALAGSLAVAADRSGRHLAALTATAQAAERAVRSATDRVSAADAVLIAARQHVAEVESAARTRAVTVDPAVVVALAGLVAAPSSADQQAADGAARTAWQARLAALSAAGITLPTDQQLRDGDLPGALTPLNDATGAAVPGVAAGVVGGAVVAVPSAETATAVSYAFAQLGAPYQIGGTSAVGIDCGGLTAAVWTAAGTPLDGDLASQWAGGAVVSADRLQAGDLVFGVDAVTGLDDVGISVGDGLVVTASALRHQVVVAPLPAGAVGIRTTVPTDTPNTVPPGTGMLPATCGATSAQVTAAPVDPAWGGWSNGRIPTSALCPIGGGHQLRCDAAAAYLALAQAYQQAFGTPLCITDSYRSYAAQQDAHERKPGITAVPGTSNHGWGLAVDLCGGVNGFGTAQHQWMDTYAGHFGWVHPDWAQSTGENPEPWHWEFGHLIA